MPRPTAAAPDLRDKQAHLFAILKRFDGLVVAFSGGVDSTFLLAAAREVLGERVAAVTAHSPLHPRRETRAAVEIARTLGVRHYRVASNEMALPEFVANTAERCYVCKRNVLAEVLRIAARIGVHHVAHGLNADDQGDFRPGRRAAEEMGVTAPLLEAGLTKSDIRRLSRRMGLPTWNKPSLACLASRIPYGTPITPRALGMVDRAENVLRDLGFEACRVRLHGDVARLEISPGALKKIMSPAIRADIVKRLRRIGFRHIAVDLEGYVQGSLNRAIEQR
jgi:uncharacterized protein